MKNKWFGAIRVGLCLLVGVAVIGVTGGATKKGPTYQGVAKTVEYNSDIKSPSLLIATQQSSFKDEIIKKVVAELKKEKVRILVTDVTKLGDIKRDDWDGVIVLTTVQNGKLQKDSHNFLAEHAKNMDSIRVIFTASSGKWESKDLEIDAVSSASKIVNIEPVVKKIIDSSYEVLNMSK